MDLHFLKPVDNDKDAEQSMHERFKLNLFEEIQFSTILNDVLILSDGVCNFHILFHSNVGYDDKRHLFTRKQDWYQALLLSRFRLFQRHESLECCSQAMHL